MAQLVACPECKKHLQVPDELLGKKVQCPECKHTFTAMVEGEADGERRTATTSVPAKMKTKKPAWDTDEEQDELDIKKKKRTKRRDPDEDDEDNDRPSRRRKSRDYAPHRGGMIMAFGLIGLVGGLVLGGIPFVFGIVAWVMGNNDLEEMRAGRMDPEGESMTQTGRICGMIATILLIVGTVIGCGFLIVYFIILLGCLVAVGAGAGAQKNFQPPRKF